MDISHILLLIIIALFLIITINELYTKYIEKLSETPDTIKIFNQNYVQEPGQVYENDTSVDNDLLIPTKNSVYNPYDLHRPANELPTQEQKIESESDLLTTNVNTSGSIPIVYSRDELTHTVYSTPSFNMYNEIDAGSGNINKDIDVHNNKSVTFSSIN
jgi:hypothetical protein